MVLIQRPEWAAAKLWFDGELNSKGRAIPAKDLKPLNPANLK